MSSFTIEVMETNFEGIQEVVRTFDLGGVLAISGQDKNYVKNFTNSESEVVVHNLNKYPAVHLIDAAGTPYLVDVRYDSVNQCTVSWSGLITGKIICN